MKTTMITLALLATLSTATAQDNATQIKPTKDPAIKEQRTAARAEKRTATMAEELGLSAEQTLKVSEINDAFAKSAAQVKSAGLEDDARKVRMKVLREGRDKQLMAVLTPEQYETLITLRNAKKEGLDGEDPKMPHNE